MNLSPNMAGSSGDARPAFQALSKGDHGTSDVSFGLDLSQLVPASAGTPLGFTVTLPLPPSTNNLFRNAGNKRVKSDDYWRWADAAGWTVKSERPAPVTGRYGFILTLPAGMRGDIDNRLKAVLDLIVKHKLTPDDSKADMVMAVRSASVAGQCCIVRVFPISPLNSVALAGVGGGPRRPSVLPRQEDAEAA